MKSLADEIREFTARNELHPLVASGAASPRGLCNESRKECDGAIVRCVLDFGHKGPHRNDRKSK